MQRAHQRGEGHFGEPSGEAYQRVLGESQGQKLNVTVIVVPGLLDSGRKHIKEVGVKAKARMWP